MADIDYLTSLKFEFDRLKSLAENGLIQITDDDFLTSAKAGSNSVAIIVKHIGGNLKSRFSDFLITDGEKPDRDRDREFEILSTDSRDSIMLSWQAGWTILTDTLNSLKPDDLSQTVLIRGEKHTVVQAVNRSLTHIAYHVGQIIWLCQQIAGENWKTLSVPRGESGEAASKGKGYLNHYGR